MSASRSRARSVTGSDLRRRRWIRRVLIVWVVLTLVAGVFNAIGKSRTRRRTPPAATPARRS